MGDKTIFNMQEIVAYIPPDVPEIELYAYKGNRGRKILEVEHVKTGTIKKFENSKKWKDYMESYTYFFEDLTNKGKHDEAVLEFLNSLDERFPD